jgi:hypothetical protein
MPGDNPMIAQRRLGEALQDLRRQARLTGEQAGAALERSGSWVSRVEAGNWGQRGLRLRDLRELFAIYQLTDRKRRAELEALFTAGQHRPWYSDYSDVVTPSYASFIGWEAAAQTILAYEGAVMPGLIQTRRYAEAVFRQTVPLVNPAKIEKLLEVRMTRQQRVIRESRPLIQVVLDEAVLKRVIGGTVVFRGQIEYLLQILREESQIDLRVLPFSRSDRAALATSFTILHLGDNEPDVVYVETASGGVSENDVASYHEVFNHLLTVALDATETEATLREVLKGLA